MNTASSGIVGVGVVVWRDGKLLGGIRLNSYGAGTWCIPGGRVEAGEDVLTCAARELFEETGLIATDYAVDDEYPWTDRPGGHNVIVTCTWQAGEAENREPNKCAGWEWQDLSHIPEPRFIELDTWLKRRAAREAHGE